MSIKLTDGEWFAYISGLILGGRLPNIVKSLNPNISTTTTTKDERNLRTTDIIAIKVGVREYSLEELALLSCIVSLPVVLVGNNDDNRGFAGFMSEFSYNTSQLEYMGYEVKDGSLNYNIECKDGVIKVTALKNSISYEDSLLMYIKFRVNVQGMSSSSMLQSYIGNFSKIVTLIDGNYNYIVPSDSIKGYILICNPNISPNGGNSIVGSVELPPTNPTYVSSNTVTSFNLNYTLNTLYPPSAPVYATIYAYIDGIVVGSYTFELSFNSPISIGGKFPITVPQGGGWKPIKYDIVVEKGKNDDNEYYMFIPAFGLEFTTSTEVDRDKIDTIPKKPINQELTQELLITDIYEIEIISREYINVDELVDAITLSDLVELDTIGRNYIYEDDLSLLGVLDLIEVELKSNKDILDTLLESVNILDVIEVVSEVDNVDLDSFKDNITVLDANEINLVNANVVNEGVAENITLLDISSVELIEPPSPYKNYMDTVSILDANELSVVNANVVNEGVAESISINDLSSVELIEPPSPYKNYMETVSINDVSSIVPINVKLVSPVQTETLGVEDVSSIDFKK